MKHSSFPLACGVNSPPADASRRDVLRAAWFAASLLALQACGGGSGGGSGGAAGPAPNPPPIPPPAPGTPAIDTFTPPAGEPRSEVFITGSNLAATPAGNSVAFNGVAASVLSASATQLVVHIPFSATRGRFLICGMRGLLATSE